MGKKRTEKYKRHRTRTNKSKRRKGGNLVRPPVERPCNPKVFLKNETVSKDTCLTKPLLKKLAKKNNVNGKKTPQEILASLRQKNTDCLQTTHTDKCLLNKAGLGHKANGIFAPPHDWKNPREWLSNFDIKAVMDMYSETYPHFHFFGPVPINFDDPVVCPNNGDNLCHFNLEKELDAGKTKFGFIFNLDFDKGPGTHWVSMFYDASPDDPKNALLFFFDSAGKSNTPSDRFAHINGLANSIIYQTKHSSKYPKLREHKLNLLFNNTRHQSGNSECGVYSLFFIITMLTRKPDIAQPNELSNSQLLDLFYGNHGIIPDNYVEQYRKVFFTEPDPPKKT